MNRKERALVAADESAGFVVGEKAKNLARVAARNQRNRPKRPRSKCEPSSQCDLYLVEYSPTYQSGNLQPASFSHQLGNIFPPHQSGNQLYFFSHHYMLPSRLGTHTQMTDAAKPEAAGKGMYERGGNSINICETHTI